MKKKTTRQVDPQGRVSIPGYIRELAGINPGDTVTVEVGEDSTLRIYASSERCCICEKPIKGSKITVGTDVHICIECARAIAYITDKIKED